MGTTAAPASDLARLAAVVAELRELPIPADTTAQIEQIRLLENAAGAISAAQARTTAQFAATRTAELAVLAEAAVAAGSDDPGVRSAAGRARRAAQDIAGQVGLAKRLSPHHARRYVEHAGVLVSDLPHTLQALRAGVISEWRAQIVTGETGWLPAADRRAVDAEIAPRLPGLGNRQVQALTRTAAYRRDPAGSLDRARSAAADRRVTLRPAPDTMTRLTALLPVAAGVAAYQALSVHADSVKTTGDERGRGQIMADTLLQRLTGHATPDDIPVCVNVIMTDHTLLTTQADADEPAVLDGYGPIPAGLARNLITDPDEQTPMWLRRLFTAPDTGDLITMDSHRRCFTPAQREFIRLRDQTCRTPHCDAPIRHTDHAIPATRQGRTSLDNAQGLCQTCNHAKQAPGWAATIDHTGQVTTTTPTGHRYRSRAPDPPGRPIDDDLIAALQPCLYLGPWDDNAIPDIA